METSVIELRPYQSEAVNCVYNHLRRKNNHPCVVIPTAGGKTPVAAQICKDAIKRWNGRVLILAHVKELLKQATDKLHAMAPDLWADIGVYSAGLKSRDTDHSVVIAGIQSVYRRAKELGWFDLIIIDEAHMIPPNGEGRYRTFLNDALTINPNVRLIGLTATPYRLQSGFICHRDNLLNEVCYEIGVRDLIDQGYICGLKSYSGSRETDYSGLHIRGGEFVDSEVNNLLDNDDFTQEAVACITKHVKEKNRKSCLIFACSVSHAERIQKTIESYGDDCGIVVGDTLPFDRAETLNMFDKGDLKYLVNVNVLTTGFDCPRIDTIALLRPTNSPGLYYQMVGRGFRLHESKDYCLVLDFGGNVQRHGPVDDIDVAPSKTGKKGEAPVRKCPECKALIHASFLKCPECGHTFSAPTPKHAPEPSASAILSEDENEAEVWDVVYQEHVKFGAMPGDPSTMRVDYQVGYTDWISEWVCPEHTGYARHKFESWWQRRSLADFPEYAYEAVKLAEAGALAETKKIKWKRKKGEKFDRITSYRLGPKPKTWDDVEVVPF